MASFRGRNSVQRQYAEKRPSLTEIWGEEVIWKELAFQSRQKCLQPFIAPVGTRQSFSEDGKWYHLVLQRRKLGCKWGVAFHPTATGRSWVGFGLLRPLTSDCRGPLKMGRERYPPDFVLCYSPITVIWVCIWALEGKISSLIFTMVCFLLWQVPEA